MARGYDAEHDAARAKWELAVEAVLVVCRRYRYLIQRGEPLDLGHPDADCPKARAPEHPTLRSSHGRTVTTLAEIKIGDLLDARGVTLEFEDTDFAAERQV